MLLFPALYFIQEAETFIIKFPVIIDTFYTMSQPFEFHIAVREVQMCQFTVQQTRTFDIHTVIMISM